MHGCLAHIFFSLWLLCVVCQSLRLPIDGWAGCASLLHLCAHTLCAMCAVGFDQPSLFIYIHTTLLISYLDSCWALLGCWDAGSQVQNKKETGSKRKKEAKRNYKRAVPSFQNSRGRGQARQLIRLVGSPGLVFLASRVHRGAHFRTASVLFGGPKIASWGVPNGLDFYLS